MDTMVDLAPVRRSTIGFDRFFKTLDEAAKAPDQAKYPPYNIERTQEDGYRLTLAVAGWTPTEITVIAKPGQLVVTGRKTPDGRHYLYQAIPPGPFEQRFALADDMKISGAQMANGLLTIDLARVVPKAATPRRIAIGRAASSASSPRSSELTLVR